MAFWLGGNFLKVSILLLAVMLLFTSCAAMTTAPEEYVKYPRKPADKPERKSGQAMLFYEAAEEDADPGNVIVIPPDEKNKGNIP